jgi:TfoX/Sxy family transcriptional regulator of competence genes
MAWKKSTPVLIAVFDRALPADDRVERRQMFGYPCAFTCGNMFTGLHEERMVVRLPEAARRRLLRERGATSFEVLGRVMREYVVLPPAVLKSPARAKRWTRAAFDYALTLPAKTSPPKTSARKAVTPAVRPAGVAPRRVAARQKKK